MSSILEGVVDFARNRLAQQAKRAEYFNDPAAWSEDMLGVKFWSKQRELSAALKDHRNIAVAAAHGLGKSYWVSILICWWIDTRYPKAFVVSTAPSQAQISAIVWRYVRQNVALVEKRYKAGLIDHMLPGYITADNQWKDVDGGLIGFGRKPPDNKEDDAVQGVHDAYVLALGDEAVGLSAQMIDALGNITSNEDSRRILIANPTNPGSYMGKLFKERPDTWKFFNISAFDSPNFTDEKKEFPAEVLSKLVGPSYVRDKKAEYGENSARYKARVLGEFAWDLGDTLVRPEDVAKAKDTTIVPTDDAHISLGVDIARFGKDLSSL